MNQRISTTLYEQTNGKPQAKDYGMWAFRIGNQVESFVTTGFYKDAAKAAKEQAKRVHQYIVVVLP